MLVPNRHGNSSAYRYGFNGKEKDDEVKGSGLHYDYGFRVYDPRIGKFLSQDPLVKNFPWWTPYQFAGNSPICSSDLDGLEFFFEIFPPTTYSPVIGTLRPSTTLPRIAIEIEPMPSEIVLPPTSILPSEMTVGQPRIDAIEEIDWEFPPSSPDDLGENWKEITDPRNKSGGRDFQNSNDPNEKIRFDPGKEGKSGWEAKDHWHRYNPTSKNKHDYYLDKDGNPVLKGSHASHIEAPKMIIIEPVIINSHFEKKNFFQRLWQGVEDFFTPDPEPKKRDKEKLQDGTLYS